MTKFYTLFALVTLMILSSNARINEKRGFRMIGQNDWGQVFTSKAGDVNGDGYPDVFFSHANYNKGGDSGAVLVYGGPTTSLNDFKVETMTSKQGIRIKGTFSQLFHELGSGDLNKDGFSDIFGVVQEGFHGHQSIFVIFGGPNLSDVDVNKIPSTQGFKISGIDTNTPIAFNSAGDLNGDGYQDIAIAYGNIFKLPRLPYVVVIYGGASLTSFDFRNMTSEQGIKIMDDVEVWGGSHFGRTVSSAGDLNGDGYDDLLVGSGVDPKHYDNRNFAYVFFGGKSLTSFNISSMTKSQGINITTTLTRIDGVRAFMSAAGDVNGDGYSDFLIGSPYEGGYTGAVYLLYGGKSLSNIDLPTLTPSQGIKIEGNPNQHISSFGQSVSSAGDFNGDGYADIIIGSAREDVNNVGDVGAVYVVYGGKSLSSFTVRDLTSNQGFRLLNQGTGNLFGDDVSGLGDVNKDGLADVLIGISSDKSGPGAAYVLFGRKNE